MHPVRENIDLFDWQVVSQHVTLILRDPEDAALRLHRETSRVAQPLGDDRFPAAIGGVSHHSRPPGISLFADVAARPDRHIQHAIRTKCDFSSPMAASGW